MTNCHKLGEGGYGVWRPGKHLSDGTKRSLKIFSRAFRVGLWRMQRVRKHGTGGTCVAALQNEEVKHENIYLQLVDRSNTAKTIETVG